MRTSFKLLGLLLLCPGFAGGEELQENYVPARPLGMGNAFTAVANDDAAVWTNPAGVARARKARTRNWFNMKLPNIGAGANARGKQLYQSQVGDKEKSLAETVAENGETGANKPYWANLQLFPVMMFDYSRNAPGALGVYSNTTTKMIVEEDTSDQARVEMISDLAPLANLTFTTDNNRFSIGMQARYVMRYAYEDTIPIEELKSKTAMQDHIKEEANQSSGIGLDFGMMYTFADFWFPTIGLSVLNLPTGCKADYLNPHSKKRETVCGNVYSGDIANEDALSTVDPTDIRAGLAITPRITRDVSLRIALDAHHLAIASGSQSIGLSGIEPQKLLHAGMELFLGNPLALPPLAVRAGVNQGFITSGFSLNLGYVAMDFATYGVDVSSESKSIEDRRYVGSLTLVF